MSNQKSIYEEKELSKSKKNVGQNNTKPFFIFKPYIFLIFKRNILSDYKIVGVTIGALQKEI